jgi:hypothetical protein
LVFPPRGARFLYTKTQFGAIDALAHPPEDAGLMAKDIEAANKAAADGDMEVCSGNMSPFDFHSGTH